MRVPDQAVEVATADFAVAALVAPAVLAVWLQPVGDTRQVAALTVRVVATMTTSPAMGSCFLRQGTAPRATAATSVRYVGV